MSLKSYIKNTADGVYSQYIRIKEANRHGYCTCITCDTVKHWTEMDAGHCFNRDDWPTRYDDRNVHPQCRHCNRFESGQIARYTIYLTQRYGNGIIEELDVKSRLVKQFTLADLKKWVREWRAEIIKMKTIKNI